VRRPDPRLLRLARGARFALAACVALGLITAGLAIGQARLLADGVASAVVDGADLARLAPILGLLGAVLASRAVISWAGEWAAQRASASVKSELRMALLRQAAEPGLVSTPGGEIVTLATRGLDALDGYFGRYLPQLVLSAILPLAVVALLLPADAVSALTVLGTLPLIVVLMVLAGRASEAQRSRRWRAMARLAHHFLDVVTGLPTLKVFGRAGAQLATLERVTDEYRRETLRALRIAFLSAFVLELFSTLSVALVAVGIGLRLVNGELDLRTGLFVLVLAPEAYLPLRQLGAHFHASEEGLAAAAAAFAILETPGPPAGARLPVPEAIFELQVEQVTVLQPGRELAAPDAVSFEVRPGEVVALAGPSGSGKTTLLEVIAGLRRPDAGEVSVRVAAGAGQVTLDRAVRELDPAAWRARIGWLAQEPYLFPGSVADNVCLAMPDASAALVRAALEAVDLGGLDLEATLEEGGRGLSAGQRRRLALARAILRPAPLLLLDEPTAGLDEATEARVLASIRDLARRERRLVVLVAHRPAALALADRIVLVRSAELPSEAVAA
jgi:thiol reductant ABC exporter CydD subunit